MITLKNSKIQACIVLLCVWLGVFITSYAQNQLSGMSTMFMEHYGFTAEEYAGLYTASTFMGIWIAFIAGVLSDNISVRWIILVCAILAALGLVYRIVTTDYMGQFIANAAPCFLATFLGVNRSKLLGGWFPPATVGIAVGIATTTTPIANTLGVGLTAMMPSVEFAFTVTAVVAVVFVVLWFLFGQERSREIAAQEEAAGEKPSLKESLKTVFTCPWVYLLAIAAMFLMASQVPVMAFTTVALVNANGMTPVAAGLMATAITIGMGVGSVVTPFIIKVIKAYRPIIAIYAIITAICIYFAWQMPVGAAQYIIYFILGFCLGALLAIIFTFPVLLVGRRFAATAGGLVQTFVLIGASLFLTNVTIPLAGGATNFGAMFTIAAIFCIVGSICLFIIPDQAKKLLAAGGEKKIEEEMAEEEARDEI